MGEPARIVRFKHLLIDMECFALGAWNGRFQLVGFDDLDIDRGVCPLVLFDCRIDRIGFGRSGGNGGNGGAGDGSANEHMAWVSSLLGLEPGPEVDASPRLASMVPRFMAKTSVVPKKKRGPAPTGKGVQVGERWHPSELAAIDAWIAASADKTLTRAHAIRRLVALGLKAKPK